MKTDGKSTHDAYAMFEYFNGYKSSFFNPLDAEMAAVWIATDLVGTLPLPAADVRRRALTEQLAFVDVSVNGHHCRATKIIPFSMHNVDGVLSDLDLNIPARVLPRTGLTRWTRAPIVPSPPLRSPGSRHGEP